MSVGGLYYLFVNLNPSMCVYRLSIAHLVTHTHSLSVVLMIGLSLEIEDVSKICHCPFPRDLRYDATSV